MLRQLSISSVFGVSLPAPTSFASYNQNQTFALKLNRQICLSNRDVLEHPVFLTRYNKSEMNLTHKITYGIHQKFE